MVLRVSVKLGNRRKTGTEQFYTPPSLASELVKATVALIPDWQQRSYLEPASGTGSFVAALGGLGVKDITAIDKYPLTSDALEVDYLDYLPPGNRYVTITNPPFGRNNALSVPFFNHAASHSDYIAFLVPRSWRKWSVQNRLDKNFHLIHDSDVFVAYENALGEPVAERNELRTCFQIWEKQEHQRAWLTAPDNGLLEKASPAEADIAIRVFGYGCGKVLRDFPRQPNTTLMFLRVQQPDLISVLERLDYQRFSRNTAYTEALSLPEINFLLNEAVFGSGLHKSEQVEN